VENQFLLFFDERVSGKQAGKLLMALNDGKFLDEQANSHKLTHQLTNKSAVHIRCFDRRLLDALANSLGGLQSFRRPDTWRERQSCLVARLGCARCAPHRASSIPRCHGSPLGGLGMAGSRQPLLLGSGCMANLRLLLSRSVGATVAGARSRISLGFGSCCAKSEPEGPVRTVRRTSETTCRIPPN
jgi:hypothetical protein